MQRKLCKTNCIAIPAKRRQLVFLKWKKGNKHPQEQIIVVIAENNLKFKKQTFTLCLGKLQYLESQLYTESK